MRAPLPLLVMLGLALGCSPVPSARVSVQPLVGPHPPQVLARCATRGLAAPIQYQWRLAPGLRPATGAAPQNEATLLVQLPDGAAANLWAECVAAGAGAGAGAGPDAGPGAGDRRARATASLVPPRISAAPTTASARQLLTVRGAGFGPVRSDDDGIYLVSASGTARPADGGCPGAAWSDAQVSACVPPSLAPGAWQLRVQAGDELALAPAPLVVTGP